MRPARSQVVVPELELEVSTGTLGGLVTTVEGLVQAVQTALKNTQARCACGPPFVCKHYGLGAGCLALSPGSASEEYADKLSAWQRPSMRPGGCAVPEAPLGTGAARNPRQVCCASLGCKQAARACRASTWATRRAPTTGWPGSASSRGWRAARRWRRPGRLCCRTRWPTRSCPPLWRTRAMTPA